MIDVSEARRDGASFEEYKEHGSENLTLNLSAEPYASGCSLCGMMRSS